VLSKSEYFDSSYYGQQVENWQTGVPKDLLGHYEQIGWRLGLDPHPGFSTNGYLSENPDVWKAGVNPLVHYEECGKAEERNIVSVAEYENRPGAEKIIRRVELVDLTYYQAQVDDTQFSDVLAALDHYLATGWREGLDPHPSFSTRGYLHDNSDVAADGRDPLTHFVHFGFLEGRPPVDPVAFSQPGYRTPETPRVAEVRESLTLYLRHLGIHSDIRDLDLGSDVSLQQGDLEWFDADFYLRLYSDVDAAGISAFAHFVRDGHREGRYPNAAIADALSLRTDTKRVLMARSVPVRVPDDDVEEVVGRRVGSSVISEIVDRGLLGSGNIIIAFAHDDYVEHVGGIQIVSAREEVVFRELGDSYISVFPSRESIALSASSPDEFLVRCRIGGELIDGSFPLVDFADAFSDGFAERSVVVVVHSVLGHSPEAILKSMELLHPSKAFWWIHDYSVHCQNYRLTRNDVNWCGDPAPDSQSCQVCSYSLVRGQHVDRVRSLIDGADWVFAAPSEVAAEQSVTGHTPLPRRPLVIPHGSIWRDGATREACSGNEKVRIAFVGYPSPAKGWNRFLSLLSEAGQDADNFEFFHFGSDDRSVPGVRFVDLQPEPGGRSTATQKLLLHRIDAIVNFVDAKETFNFVTFEAMAAGCCIVTSSRSGNVVVAASAESLLIERDCDDDFANFDYLALRDEIRRKRRNDIGEFRLTGLTASLLTEAKL
jgi:glycosyltransferase involved in cell wall biosynthesis